ncbi:ribosomal protection-like ABC-F family protein [Kribbella sp. NPDC051770]|uniref:ribosomal protection-like ABC-F family protein n=1 Tax=Kribbella sp. NPDC051770 TaxID=3155413 RepID=UPI00344186DC
MRDTSNFQAVLADVVRAPGGRTVLDGVSQSVALGERIGVIGENGSGKSTLIRVLAGIDRPDGGQVRTHVPGGIGYLPETPELPPGDTVQDAVDHALAELRSLETRMRETEESLSSEPANLDELLTAYGELLEAFEARDGYAADARVESAMHGLGLADIKRDRLLGSLSGGEQCRLGLACILAASPQLLLLDEPTNHLDASALEWLEERLRNHPGSLVVVSHDRVFLERVTTALWEVDGEQQVVVRHGNGYAGYLQARQTARLRWEQEYEDWQVELARQKELARKAANTLASGPRPDAEAPGRHQRNVEKQISARVRQAKERVRRLEEEPVLRPPAPMRFTAKVAGGSSRTSTLADLHQVKVDGRLDVRSLEIKAGDRLHVIGPNGAGKTTLLRVLAGDLAPDQGDVRRPARIGWLPQQTVVTRPGEPLLSAYARGLGGTPDEHRGALLGLGLFRHHDLHTPVGKLSTGQLRRLDLARLLHRPVDLMLLDEPTNHLSPALVEDLENALSAYGGALVVVSHDRMLARRFAGRTVELCGGRLAG